MFNFILKRKCLACEYRDSLLKTSTLLFCNSVLNYCGNDFFILGSYYPGLKQNEPGHEKMCLMSYANNKSADQPAHPRSLISAFVVRYLDSIIYLDSIAEISRF